MEVGRRLKAGQSWTKPERQYALFWRLETVPIHKWWNHKHIFTMKNKQWWLWQASGTLIHEWHNLWEDCTTIAPQQRSNHLKSLQNWKIRQHHTWGEGCPGLWHMCPMISIEGNVGICGQRGKLAGISSPSSAVQKVTWRKHAEGCTFWNPLAKKLCYYPPRAPNTSSRNLTS